MRTSLRSRRPTRTSRSRASTTIRAKFRVLHRELRAGTEPNIFYIDFTDLPQVLTAGQAADITSVRELQHRADAKDIVPGAMQAVTAGKTLYGLPTNNYTQGLIYNRKLFRRPG